MKQILILLIFFYPINLLAQGGMWTWMKGDSVVVNTVSPGNYGTLGVRDTANEIPGRYHCTYWTDTSGNFWVFGGQIFNVGELNDLWRYEPDSNIWTWMKGPQIVTNSAGSYGTLGVPAASNNPPAHALTSHAWTDKDNNLWMVHKRGDVWKYSIATNEWTWMNGYAIWNQPAVFGMQGVASPLNTPGMHTESKASWKDANDDLWMYNDGNIWRYSISTNMWTWLKGPGSGINLVNYGTMGVPAPTNQPVAGSVYNFWQDQNGKFYIGFNVVNNTTIWRYDPLTNMWTWIDGGQNVTVNAGRRFISQCTGSTDRNPGSRVEARNAQNTTTCVEDLMWFCGGQNFGYFNDLWVYKMGPKTWTWVSGDSVQGNYGQYGTRGLTASTNMLPCRTGHAMWVDKYQRTWIFGGIVRGNVSRGNDLWKFEPDMNCLGIQLDTFQLYPPADLDLCLGDTSSMYVASDFNNLTIQPATGYTLNTDTTKITFQPLSTTTYTIQAVTSGLCPTPRQITFTILVHKDTLPNFQNFAYCTSDSVMINLDTSYQFIFNPSGSVNYNAGGASASIHAGTTTTYTVSATRLGCPVLGTKEFTVTVVPYPNAAFNISPTQTSIESPVLNLNNKSTGYDQIAWYYQNNLIDTNDQFIYTATDTGLYCFKLIAINELGCPDSVEHCAEIIPGGLLIVPNAFSPNGDGANDVFQVIHKNISLKSFKIFNRWGQELFYTTDIKKGWDGNYKGKPCELGVYFYLIEYSDPYGKNGVKKGDVTLVR